MMLPLANAVWNSLFVCIFLGSIFADFSCRIPVTMSGALEAAEEEVQRLKIRLKESQEQVQQAAHAGLDLLNQQVELQTQLEEQRVEMTNTIEVCRRSTLLCAQH